MASESAEPIERWTANRRRKYATQCQGGKVGCKALGGKIDDLLRRSKEEDAPPPRCWREFSTAWK